MYKLITLLLLFSPYILTAKTYYLDGEDGDDANDGLSPGQAWKSIGKLNYRIFYPGDSILFRRGTECTGHAQLQGSGLAGKPVYLGAYGKGGMPQLSTEDEAIVLSMVNVSHYHIEGLEFQAPRGGALYIDAVNSDAMSFRVNNCVFHTIKPEADHRREVGRDYAPLRDKAAIRIGTWHNKQETMLPFHVSNVWIDNCEFYHVHNGVIVTGNIDEHKGTLDGCPRTQDVRITGSYFHDIPSEAIVILGCENSLVRNCIFRNVCTDHNHTKSNYIAPVWFVGSSHGLVEYCEVSGSLNENGDAMTIDFDWRTDHCTYRHNYSHDNHRFMRSCPKHNHHNAVHNNLSVNDELGISWYSYIGNEEDLSLQNNTCLDLGGLSLNGDRMEVKGNYFNLSTDSLLPRFLGAGAEVENNTLNYAGNDAKNSPIPLYLKASLPHDALAGTYTFDYQVDDNMDKPANKALGKKAQTSSMAEGAQWSEMQLTDGQIYTTNGQLGWSSKPTDKADKQEWATIDLGQRETIRLVVLHARNDVGNMGFGMPREVYLELSDDGENWTYSEKYLISERPLHHFSLPVNIESGRYVRLRATKLQNNRAEGFQYSFQCAEIAIY
jgi:hypothetical protein